MTARTADQPPVVEKPKHKLSQLTTYELRDYRRELDQVLLFLVMEVVELAPGLAGHSSTKTQLLLRTKPIAAYLNRSFFP